MTTVSKEGPPVVDSQAPPVPRFSRRRAALVVVGALTLIGALIGALWSVLAPPVHGVIALTKSGNRVQAYLGAEADHFFVAAFMLLGLLCVVAVVAAVAAWQWRAHRGPAMVLAVCVGSILAAAAAAGVGAVLVAARYPVVEIDAAPVSPDHRVHYITEAPAVFFGHTPGQIAVTLLIPAAVAALTYALFAVAAVRDDLGGYPPVEGVVLGVPTPAVTAEGGSAPDR